MQMLSNIQGKVQEFAAQNATTILTAGGVVGVVGTGVLAWRGGMKYQQLVISEDENRRYNSISSDDADQEPTEYKPLTALEKAQLAGVHFIPPVLTGGVTIVAIIMSHRMSAQKAAALAAAYGLSRQQFEEYKEKVAEKLTGPKQEAVSSELAQERANRNPHGASQIVIVDGNDILCFDEPTGRYFKSNMEKINRAVNKTNEEIINGEYATANYFYDLLGLDRTTWGDEVGWNRDNLVDLDISTIFSPEDESTPVISINFKKMPDSYYLRKMYE